MKRVAVLVCAIFVAGLALAHLSPVLAVAKTHKMSAEIVSIDVEAKTITIKDEKGETKTAPVLGKAAEKLSTLHAGDKVTLTCKDKESGEHEGVEAIEMAKKAG